MAGRPQVGGLNVSVFSIAQNTWGKGQLGAYMDARSDLKIYRESAKSISNFLVLPQGGLDFRRGLEFIDQLDVEDASQVRLVEWAFNADQKYLLAFTDESVAIYRDKELKATIVTPYVGEDLRDLRFTQSGDTMIIVHDFYDPAGLERDGTDVDWTLGVIDFQTVPFFRHNTAQDMTPSGTTGSITLTLSPTDDYFTSDHVGVKVKVNGGQATITAVTNGYTVSATVTANLSGTSSSSAWEEELWGTAKGFPRTAEFHENRLWFGGVRDASNVMAASKVADFFNFDLGSGNDDEAIVYSVANNQVQAIRDLKSQGGVLNIFCDSGTFVGKAGSDAITPTNFIVSSQTTTGVLGIPVVEVGGELIFAANNSKDIYSFYYDFASDSYKTDLKTVVSHEIFTGTARPLAMAKIRSYRDTQANVMIVPRSDGTLAMLTIDTPREVLAWYVWSTSGSFHDAVTVGTDHGDGLIIDTVYLVVERDTGVFIEALTEAGSWLDHFYYGHSDTPKAQWAGMDTMVGQTIRVVADGFVQNPVMVTWVVTDADVDDGGTGYVFGDLLTVAGDDEDLILHVDSVSTGVITAVSIQQRGSFDDLPTNPVSTTGGTGSGATFDLTLNGGFTLSDDFSDVYAGLTYDASCESHDLTAAVDGNIKRGAPIKKVRATVNLKDTLTLRVDDYPVDSQFRPLGPTLLDQAPTPFSGIKTITLSGISRSPSVFLRVTEPQPCTVLALTVDIGVPTS